MMTAKETIHWRTFALLDGGEISGHPMCAKDEEAVSRFLLR